MLYFNEGGYTYWYEKQYPIATSIIIEDQPNPTRFSSFKEDKHKKDKMYDMLVKTNDPRFAAYISIGFVSKEGIEFEPYVTSEAREHIAKFKKALEQLGDIRKGMVVSTTAEQFTAKFIAEGYLKELTALNRKYRVVLSVELPEDYISSPYLQAYINQAVDGKGNVLAESSTIDIDTYDVSYKH
jgi:hypothetical protein